MKKIFLLQILLLLFVQIQVFAQQSRSLPVPPPNINRGLTPKPPLTGQGGDNIVVISGVPSYLWKDGCGPTSLGMVIGYYDGIGFSDLVPGDASLQTTDVQNMISTNDHYIDYSKPIDSYPNLLQDKSETGGAHTSNCLADFMKTSWSIEGNYYGWSWSDEIENAFDSYVPFINPEYWSSSAYVYYSDIAAWNAYMEEIDNNRPVVLLVDTDGNGYTDHFVTGIGYNSTSKLYAVFDTWNHNIHWYDWRGLKIGNFWGIYGYTKFSLKFKISATTSNSNQGTVSGSGTFYANQPVSLVASPTTGYQFLNWSEAGSVVSTQTIYNFNASGNRDLVANFQAIPPFIPEFVTLNVATFQSDFDGCYNANQTIIIAGEINATVSATSGSKVRFVAGQSIQFLPGFHAHNGSTVHAYISTNGIFCEGAPSPSPVQTESKSGNLDDEHFQAINSREGNVKIYPNPNNGSFHVELTNMGNALMTIYNSNGKKIVEQQLTGAGANTVNIQGFPSGIYIARIAEGKKFYFKKFIIQ
jgi:hypothetical protein